MALSPRDRAALLARALFKRIYSHTSRALSEQETEALDRLIDCIIDAAAERAEAQPLEELLEDLPAPRRNGERYQTVRFESDADPRFQEWKRKREAR